MAQVKLLKIGSDGIPVEFNAAADDITLNSFTVDGGLVASDAGIDMNDTAISEASGLAFNDPATDGITQTAGVVASDNLMAKERSNILTVAADILFPVVTDVAGAIDALRLPALAGAPTATPTVTGEGFLVWDSTNDKLYIWNGTAWVDQASTGTATALDDIYTAGEAILISEAVYLSAADTVSLAEADVAGRENLLGFAVANIADEAAGLIRKNGALAGFTGLTAAARYYLSDTAGAIASSAPVGSGNVIVQAGYAKNTTTLDIQIQSLGRRA